MRSGLQAGCTGEAALSFHMHTAPQQLEPAERSQGRSSVCTLCADNDAGFTVGCRQLHGAYQTPPAAQVRLPLPACSSPTAAAQAQALAGLLQQGRRCSRRHCRPQAAAWSLPDASGLQDWLAGVSSRLQAGRRRRAQPSPSSASQQAAVSQPQQAADVWQQAWAAFETPPEPPARPGRTPAERRAAQKAGKCLGYVA